MQTSSVVIYQSLSCKFFVIYFHSLEIEIMVSDLWQRDSLNWYDNNDGDLIRFVCLAHDINCWHFHNEIRVGAGRGGRGGGVWNSNIADWLPCGATFESANQNRFCFSNRFLADYFESIEMSWIRSIHFIAFKWKRCEEAADWLPCGAMFESANQNRFFFFSKVVYSSTNQVAFTVPSSLRRSFGYCQLSCVFFYHWVH